MQINRLRIENFRNIREAFLELPPGMQLLIGRNAQGKTSFLEAIYLLATATSHRTHNNRELIRQGETTAFIEAEFTQDGTRHRLSTGFDARERRFRVDEKPLRRVSDLYGILRAVFFSPEDLEFLSGGPIIRRRTMDLGLCQQNPPLVRVLLDYRKALKQRNTLLRQGDSSTATHNLVKAWNPELIRLGTRILSARAEYTLRLIEKAAEYYATITATRETLTGSYRSNTAHQAWRKIDDIPDEESLKQFFEIGLNESAEKDFVHRQTHTGPHRDDIILEVCGKSAERYASQGQRRSIVLALKLAERDLLTNPDDSPILLVDDVTHEMDMARCSRFLENICTSGQVFLTFTETESHRGLVKNASEWHVEDGVICCQP